MAEQLSFRLEPALTRPAEVAPMWPTPAPEPFDSPAHLFEPTWAGHRVLVFVDPAPDGAAGGGTVRVVDADGRDLASVLPELAGLAVRVAAASAVLDGELVVADARGRPDVDGLAARLAGRPGRPVALLVYDVIHVDGRWLLAVPLTKRRRELRRILRPGDEVVAVPAIAGDGRALFDAVATQGIPGMLAREAASPYLPGVRSTLWRSVAVRPDASSSGGGAGTDADADAEPGAEAGAADGAGMGTGPVLALFRRLPLGDDPEG
jgi:bifunctional non-homologous end joining protein LigD